ncbi:MAG: carboxypeptidase regulatory-like domain-containing protein [Gemmatimonadetes bacterium]|nr:carboxypeptidase regulatory-like domain-containing protein [Gemmatimonadota bacterium]
MRFRTRGLFASIAMIALALHSARAQAQAVLKGMVLVNITETPIAGAEVTLPALNLRATSDSSGRFLIRGIPAGNYAVTVRHIRYSPISSLLSFGATDTVDTDMLLTAAQTVLPTVAIAGEKAPTGKLSAFDERRRSGAGHFLTEADLKKNENGRLAEALARLPGNKVLSGSSQSSWLYGGRGVQSRSSSSTPSVDPFDKAKGAKSGYCYSAVVLDGIFVYQGNPGESLFDLNSVLLSEIAGVESYAGGATIPAMYNGTRSTCGLIVIWTK